MMPATVGRRKKYPMQRRMRVTKGGKRGRASCATVHWYFIEMGGNTERKRLIT